MILGAGTPYYGYCFEEIDAAVCALTNRTVVFNEKHHFKAPEGSIIFNLENVPTQVNPALWKGHEIWDCSPRNIAQYPSDVPVTHVPIGYHPSMTRFNQCKAEDQDIDVIFCGYMNQRRYIVIEELRVKGLNVALPEYKFFGKERDALIARSKLALDMRYYEDGIFPALRSLHLAANRVPVVAETSEEMPPWAIHHFPYKALVPNILDLVYNDKLREQLAQESFNILQNHPLQLPYSPARPVAPEAR